jgi:predicted metal-dependent hydrolase
MAKKRALTEEERRYRFGIAKSRLKEARQALEDAASLLREIGLTEAAERYERLASKVQQFD